MSTRAHAAQLKIEKLVDAIAVQAEYRPAIVALATQAYIIGLSDSVIEQHATTEMLAKLAHELAGPLNIKFETPKQTSTKTEG